MWTLWGKMVIFHGVIILSLFVFEYLDISLSFNSLLGCLTFVLQIEEILDAHGLDLMLVQSSYVFIFIFYLFFWMFWPSVKYKEKEIFLWILWEESWALHCIHHSIPFPFPKILIYPPRPLFLLKVPITFSSEEGDYMSLPAYVPKLFHICWISMGWISRKTLFAFVLLGLAVLRK